METIHIRSLQYQITSLIPTARQTLHAVHRRNLSSNLGPLGAFTDMNVPDSKGSLGERVQFGILAYDRQTSSILCYVASVQCMTISGSGQTERQIRWRSRANRLP
jgi:hypothetical protein